MKTSEFNFDLPERLIAQSPIINRAESRLLILDRKTGSINEGHFYDIKNLLEPGDTLVINETKVLPARVFAKKNTGALVEFLFLERLDDRHWSLLAKPGRKARVGDSFTLSDRLSLEIVEILEDGLRKARLSYDGIFEEILEEIGTMPLPPYIHRSLEDKSRYQTVYAKNLGSSAAPTAGLHFTPGLLEELEERGVRVARLNLHVGLGTFRPVKAEDIKDHHMHEESYYLDEENAELIRGAKRVVAVGTTSVRTLESIYKKYGEIKADRGSTDIFIYPGYKFGAVDLLITNFHLPQSTLLMLVSAFYSREKILEAYKYAVERDFRFFSFGDAMIIGDLNV